MRMGTLRATETRIKDVIAKPGIDCYIVSVGVNDLRTEGTKTVADRIYSIVTSLINTSDAKVLVCCLTPCNTRWLNEKISIVNQYIEDMTSDMRTKLNLHNRLFTVFNRNFRQLTADQQNELYLEDGLHLSSGGASKLFANIKLQLLRSFKIPLPNRRGTAPYRNYVR